MILHIGDMKFIFPDMEPLYGDMNLVITDLNMHVGHVCAALTYFAGNSPRCLAAHTAIMQSVRLLHSHAWAGFLFLGRDHGEVQSHFSHATPAHARICQ